MMTIALLSAQSIIMFSLGIGLEFDDFKRVIRRPLAMAVGIFGQLMLLPLIALATIYIFELTSLFAAGLLILSFCPGGVTSNIVSKLSRSDVALSVSLTAILSVLSFLTVPPLIAWSIGFFLDKASLTFSFFDLASITFLVTTVPVFVGVLIRHYLSEVAKKIQVFIEKVAIVLWVVIVMVAIVKSWELVEAHFQQLGIALLFMPLSMMLVGLSISRAARLSLKESKTVAVEMSIQNSPLAIALAATISGGSEFITALALPAAIYSLTMYLVALPFIGIFRFFDTPSKLKLTAMRVH
ncbi:bile acid:sodium symporter family protein [Alteromonas macleodii]